MKIYNFNKFVKTLNKKTNSRTIQESQLSREDVEDIVEEINSFLKTLNSDSLIEVHSYGYELVLDSDSKPKLDDNLLATIDNKFGEYGYHRYDSYHYHDLNSTSYYYKRS